MEKIVKFSPAFDKRNSDPSKNYGIHGVDMRMILKGDTGAVQFVVYTGWHLPHVQKEMRAKMHPDKYSLFEPMPADIGYHSLHPMYQDQDILSKECEYLNGKPCYYDGSGIMANEVYVILLEKGSDGVWEYLEKYYIERFGELK